MIRGVQAPPCWVTVRSGFGTCLWEDGKTLSWVGPTRQGPTPPDGSEKTPETKRSEEHTVAGLPVPPAAPIPRTCLFFEKRLLHMYTGFWDEVDP